MVLGLSAPLSPTLFDHGVDAITGFVPSGCARLADALGTLNPASMFENGYRVERTLERL